MTDGEERTDLEVLDLGALDFSDSYVARAPRAPEAVPTEPAPEKKPRRSRRRIVVAVVAVIVLVAAGAAVLIDRDGDGAADTSSPEPTIDLGSTPESDPVVAPAPYGASVLVTADDGAYVLDLDTEESRAVEGLPPGPVEILDETDGIVVVRAGTPSALHALRPGDPARRLDVDAAAPADADRVWLARGRELWPSDDPEDRSPMPANHRLVAATDSGVLLQGPDGEVVGIEPADSGSSARTTIPGTSPRVLDVAGSRVAWVESSCTGPCDVMVSDLEQRVSARVPLDRPLRSVALSPNGLLAAVVARDGRIAIVDLVGQVGEVEFRSPGADVIRRVAWRPDGKRLFVVVTDPPRLLALDPNDPRVDEVELDGDATGLAWAGPSANGGPEWAPTSSRPTLQGDRFPLNLGEPSGISLAWLGERDVHVLDVDSGVERTMRAPAQTGGAPTVTSAGDGWLVMRPGSSFWYPPGGGPRVRLDGGGDWTIGDAATGRLFLVQYSSPQTGIGGVEVRVFDSESAALSEPARVFLDPFGAVDGGVLFGAPPDLDRPSSGLIWLDVATGERRDIAAPADGAYPIGAGGSRIVWRRGECIADCSVIVTDAQGSLLRDMPAPSRGFDTASIAPDGRHALLTSYTAPFTALVDLETGEQRDVPADVVSWPVGWSRSGWFVFGSNEGGTGPANHFKALAPSGEVHELGEISADMISVR